MTLNALAKLQHRCERLGAALGRGTATEIAAARELLRQSLVELYEQGYWREQPEQFKQHMRLFRSVDAPPISARVSSSVPDKRAQYSP
ncbi:hypothetical protein [Sphingorhabdus sp.]|uniref:hypothetical protein n=1 Tax=Sphingorhabdus sp. TaxID=1902408 RepID=UPI003594783E